MLLEVHPINPQERLIQQAVEILENDGIIIYPTDTCYGIGCSIFSKKAIERIYHLKHYKKTKQLSIICSDISDISKYAVISDLAYRNMKRLLPGPYTCIMRATKLVPKTLSDKKKEVGIRIPDNSICNAIVEALGHPLLSAGAGPIEDEEMANHPALLHDHFGEQVDMVLDGGVLEGGYSTILRFEGETVEVQREGKGEVDFL
jgi:tRNA threonylcarbamoyl adenosine modification protein (Sua5/YciO/YrdC/YwlC family)